MVLLDEVLFELWPGAASEIVDFGPGRSGVLFTGRAVISGAGDGERFTRPGGRRNEQGKVAYERQDGDSAPAEPFGLRLLFFMNGVPLHISLWFRSGEDVR